MELIKCVDLSIGYGSDVIQNHITFEINEGDYVCVLGENGAGKTTLIKTMLGLISPINGTLEINGSIKNEGIGYLPQQGIVQRTFPTTVKEVVLSGRQNKIKLFYSKNDKKIADDIMKKFDIFDLKNKRYSDLSGGQQQRVLLARALCVSDKMLILDEPITGLDIKNQELLYDLIETLNKNGTTIIMISHDSNVLSKNASHVLCVNSNNVKLSTVKEYLEVEQHE